MVLAPPTLSLAEWVVLAVVDEAPTHGFAVATLTAAGGELGRVWQIPRPVVYRSLGRLETAELVVPEATEAGRGPRRQMLASTPAGHRVVAEWLETPVGHVRDVRSQLLSKLALLHRRGLDPSRLLLAQRAVLTPIAAAYVEEAADPLDDFESTLHLWRRSTAAATLAFVDELLTPGGRGRAARPPSAGPERCGRPGRP